MGNIDEINAFLEKVLLTTEALWLLSLYLKTQSLCNWLMNWSFKGILFFFWVIKIIWLEPTLAYTMILAASFDKKLFQLYSNRNNICQWLYKTGTHWLKHLGFMNLKQLSWQEHTLYQWILQTNYLSPVDHCKRSSLYFLFNFFFFEDLILFHYEQEYLTCGILLFPYKILWDLSKLKQI